MCCINFKIKIAIMEMNVYILPESEFFSRLGERGLCPLKSGTVMRVFKDFGGKCAVK